jgi:hypothetical protein
VLAPTKVQCTAGFCGIGVRQKIGTFVRPIAERLTIAFAARAPKVLLAFNDFDGIGALLSDYRIGHRILQQ